MKGQNDEGLYRKQFPIDHILREEFAVVVFWLLASKVGQPTECQYTDEFGSDISHPKEKG